jgi:hypothetical protein
MTGRKLRFMTSIDELTRSRAPANLTIPCPTDLGDSNLHIPN